MKFHRPLLAALVAALTTVTLAHSVRADESAPTAGSDTALGTMGEIFLKGSIDGKHLFMVLGMEKALDASKDIAEWAIDKDGLRADGEEVADDFKEVSEDFDEAFKTGVHFTKNGGELLKENAPEIWRAPWRSLKKIPGAYRVNFDRAQDAYYGSKNASVGALKYAGWAAWANIEGVYYLVIEAPAKVVGEVLFNTAIATGIALRVSGSLAFGGIIIAWDSADAVLHSAWVGTKIVLRATAGLVATIATVSYSLLSTGTVELLTGVAYVGVMTYRGGKFLVYKLPRRLRYPVSVTRETDVNYEDQSVAALSISDALNNGLELPGVGEVSFSRDVQRYRSRFELYDTRSDVGAPSGRSRRSAGLGGGARSK